VLDRFLDWLLDPAGLTPHGFCLLWEPELIWAHGLSNLAIGLAYLSIPLALGHFLRRRRDLAFRPVFWLFAAFILLCGTGHLVDLLTLWVPAYGLEAVVKSATAAVSVVTAASLWPLMPRALALPSPAQLQAANAALGRVAEERGRAVAALRESEARFRAQFLRSPVPLLALDGQGVITGASDRWLDLLGADRAEVIGRHFDAFREDAEPGAAEADWAALLRDGEVTDLPRRLRRRDGTVIDVLVSARVERDPVDGAPWVLGAAIDVTARNRAEAALRDSEERLRQSQRMEALGLLAGGVAHDFNNVLQAVVASTALIGRRAEDPAAVRRLARATTEAAERGASISRRLLGFARRDVLEASDVPAAELLRGLQEILRPGLGARFRLEIAADPALPPMLADRGQLEAVLINLVANARDAMPEGGLVVIAAATETAAGRHPAGLRPGRYVRLDVLDSGAGMPPEVLARATEPFFTTKPEGRGTGLGLAMARGFAQQSGGALAIESAPGRGTQVRLWLPEAAPVARAALPHGLAVPPPPPKGRRWRVLLVEDERAIREMLAAELAERGLEVTVAEHAEAALHRLAAAEEPDVLVTDMTMPGMDGLRLIAAARRRCPALPALLLTGYAGGATLGEEPVLAEGILLLRKPAGGALLLDRIARLLGAGAEAPA
jgi:PAS domain S-box-containing protein